MSGMFLFLLCRLLIEFCLCLCVQAGRLGVMEGEVHLGNGGLPASQVSVVAGMELDAPQKMVCCFAGGGGGEAVCVWSRACGGFCVCVFL